MRTVVAIGAAFLIGLYAFAAPGPEREVLYQASVLDALLAGGYEGMITIADIKTRGDLGIGTFDGLDGEMVMDRGVVYQIKHDGKVVVAPDRATSPFAIATFLDPDQTFEIKGIAGMAELLSALKTRIQAPNHFYAIRIEGEFASVKTRSVPAQLKPYPPLAEVLKSQAVFDFGSLRGTIVGFYCPPYVGGVNLAGFHLHFISQDKKSGGHLLDLKLIKAAAVLDQTPTILLELPKNQSFQQINFEPNPKSIRGLDNAAGIGPQL
jgi:acetolactate decarboxylase